MSIIKSIAAIMGSSKAKAAAPTKPTILDRATPVQRAHQQTCIQAYHAKALMVKHGKGNHTLAGIPKEWVS